MAPCWHLAGCKVYKARWGQCGGKQGWDAPIPGACCKAGLVCTRLNALFWRCDPKPVSKTGTVSCFLAGRCRNAAKWPSDKSMRTQLRHVGGVEAPFLHVTVAALYSNPAGARSQPCFMVLAELFWKYQPPAAVTKCKKRVTFQEISSK